MTLVKNNDIDELGNNYAATHALWIIDGLGAISKDDKAEEVITDAIGHPSAGVRKAAIQILSKSRLSEEVVTKSKILQDPDPNTRLAAIVALTEVSPSGTLGEILYQMSQEESVNNDHWLGKAVYAAAGQHKQGFIDAFMKVNPGYKSTPEEIKKREAADWNDISWKQMELPQNFEKAGLNIDGLVWFRKTIDVPRNAAGKKGTLSLGPVDDSDITWINGGQVGSIERKRNEKRIYEIPAGILKAGKNVVAVRVEDYAGNGGIYGAPTEMFLESGGQKISLTGEWSYEVEKEYNPKRVFGNASIAEVFVNSYLNPTTANEGNTTASNGVATKIHLKVIKNEMKYDLKTFTVEAGKPVEITFENPDFMQHNLVIVQPGTLETVGKAADKLASDPKGAEMQLCSNYFRSTFLNQAGKSSGNSEAQFYCAGKNRRLSFCLHVPRTLVNHEWHNESCYQRNLHYKIFYL